MTLNILLLVCLIFVAVWTVLTRSLLRSAIALAGVSVILTIIMFRLDSPIAAVFELSVCAGLIPVLFISTISLTRPMTALEVKEASIRRMPRFILLPFIVIAVAAILFLVKLHGNLVLPAIDAEKSVSFALWNTRQVDLIGQIIVILAGVFGVVILFKEGSEQ